MSGAIQSKQYLRCRSEQQYLQCTNIERVEASSGGSFFGGGGDNGIGLLQMTAARMSFSSNNTYVIYDSLRVQVYYRRFDVVGHHAVQSVSTHTIDNWVERSVAWWLGVIFRSKHTLKSHNTYCHLKMSKQCAGDAASATAAKALLSDYYYQSYTTQTTEKVSHNSDTLHSFIHSGN